MTVAIEVSRTIVAVLLFSFLALPQARGAEALKKIRIASKAPGESLVPYMISQRLGFYREEGFDVDVIVTRGTVTTQVVVSGAVDYGNGGSIPAILGGARMKILQVSTDKPSQYLVVSPKITNIKQLNGKTVAISDTSGNSTLLFRELLAKNGVAIETVQMRALGEPSVRFGALLAGTVDATMITIGNARIAQAKGFRILAYSGDYVSSLSANLETSDDKIQKRARRSVPGGQSDAEGADLLSSQHERGGEVHYGGAPHQRLERSQGDLARARQAGFRAGARSAAPPKR